MPDSSQCFSEKGIACPAFGGGPPSMASSLGCRTGVPGTGCGGAAVGGGVID
jgi:hypothetical protein